MRQYFQEIIWALRIWWLCKITAKYGKESYSQFLSCVGYYIACGKLPSDILERFNLPRECSKSEEVR